jgi:NADPH-dependent 2,4-dienoyl-CoA reductase/sulfur reductase-like enzyme
MNRRELLGRLAGCGGLSTLAGCAALRPRPSAARVVVVGGGYGGATAAKYVRLLSGDTIEVILIEPNPRFVSAPLSNLVVVGALELADLTTSYDALRRRHGITLVQDTVSGLDPDRKQVRLGTGSSLRYDKLVLSPGVELELDAIEGLAAAQARGAILPAWTAGSQTVGLHRQLASISDGGVLAIAIPEAPYRCPPAPYERASLAAEYFRRYKPRSKVLVLDANQDVIAMAPLFKRAWADRYDGVLEYRNHCRAIAVDAATRTVRFEVADDVQAEVLNVLPPMRAAAITTQSGLANVNGRWCGVDFLTFESRMARDIHILGDSIQGAPKMPKSGHMANGHAKVAAAAIVAELEGREPNPRPMLTNTCYSFVGAAEVIHSVSVYGYVPGEKTFEPIDGAAAASKEASALEARYARAWASNIWADMLG